MSILKVLHCMIITCILDSAEAEEMPGESRVSQEAASQQPGTGARPGVPAAIHAVLQFPR